METLKFVIVGHVDHGKSTLIGRLLYDTHSLPPDKLAEVEQASGEYGKDVEFAFLMDHLREERDQGITIDTAQTFFRTAAREYVIIDAPGHVEFVRNMFTGASQAEAAILIIDAAEGVREQTKRHAYILSMLGIGQVIVVVNKMDLVKYDEETFDRISKEIVSFLATLKISPRAVIPVCASLGENVASGSERVNWYAGGTVLEILDTLSVRPTADHLPLVFPVQDIYKIDDKRIVAGRIEAGSVRRGQTVTVLPANKTAKVQTVEKFPGQEERCGAGECVGLTTEDPVFLDRGDIICEQGKEPRVTNRFRANIFWMARSDHEIGTRLTLKCATQETGCVIETVGKRINSSTLEIIETGARLVKCLESADVVIRTKNPVALRTFNELQELGRFVLVQGANTCAGGIVTAVNGE